MNLKDVEAWSCKVLYEQFPGGEQITDKFSVFAHTYMHVHVLVEN